MIFNQQTHNFGPRRCGFPIYLKLKYNNNYGRPIVIKATLRGACKIYEVIQKNPLTNIVEPEGIVDEASRATNVVDLNSKKEEILLGYVI